MNAPLIRDRARFIDTRLSFLSRFEKQALVSEYERREQKHGHRSANIWLRKLTARALDALGESAFLKPLTGDKSALYGDRELKHLAEAHARECQTRIGDYSEQAGECYETNINAVYGALSVYVAEHGLSIPYIGVKTQTVELLETAVLKMACPKWWHRKLSRQRSELLEFIQVAIGRVKRGVSPYISKKGLAAHRKQVRAGADFLEMMEALSEDGEAVPLAELFEKSSNHPEKRRIELMVRCRGMEELAQELRYDAVFLTLTTPSKYHASSRKWQGSTPKDAQNYLTDIWKLTRAKLAKLGIEYFGVRVAEPHHDGTPHWHLLVFVRPEHRAALVAEVQSYALREDGDEAGAAKNRFDAVTIDPSKGSATGYIAKYISKNINGERMTGANDIDEEAQTGAAEGAERVRAWASTWRNRQFQFFGASGVSVWRELRRLKEPTDNERIEAMRGAADAAKWSEFQKLIKETPATLSRIDDGVTEYNEPKTRVIGVELKAGPGVVTRAKRWLLRKRGDSRVTWTRVINCNQRENDNERQPENRGFGAVGAAKATYGQSESGPNHGFKTDLGTAIRSSAEAIFAISRGVTAL